VAKENIALDWILRHERSESGKYVTLFIRNGMIHGDRDPVVPLAQSRMLHEGLLKVGAKSALLTIPGAAHGGEEFHTTENMGPVIAFFDRSLAAPPTIPSVVR
jgi:pimeloyl-ACP methyl ester carboxylesterase